CYRNSSPEVTEVVRFNTWLTWFAAVITSYRTCVGKPLHENIERTIHRHILEQLLAGVTVQSCCIGDYLRELPPCDVVVGTEVGSIIKVAWLVRSTACVAT